MIPIMLVFAYIAGSINFSILLFRILKKGDPRKRHSGNAGATNVYRQAGPAAAFAVLALDVGRAMAVAILSKILLPPGFVTWTGLALIVGNTYPCFHGFQGGKGVANFLGFYFVLCPAASLVSLGGWGIAFKLTKQPFFGSFCLVGIIAIGSIFTFHMHFFAVLGTLVTAGFVVFNHRLNLKEYYLNT